MSEIYNGLWALIITSSILIAIPGPSVMFFIGQVLTEGRRNALYGVLGNAMGMFIVAFFMSLGLGVLIQKSDFILNIIRILGVIVLLLIGIQYLMGSKLNLSNSISPLKNKRKSLMTGIIVGITNPKSFIMFGIIVPSFLTQNTSNLTYSLMVYSIIPIVLGIWIDCAWVTVAHAISTRIYSHSSGVRRINFIGGLLIILMALILAWESFFILYR